MHNAAWYGHFEVVKLLADRGASIQILDKHNRAPFFFACQGRSEEIAMYLLEKYIKKGLGLEEINRSTRSGRTPFRQAAAHGMLTVVEKLHELFSSQDTINVRDTRKGRTALHCAALRGRSAVVKSLLEKGADMNLKEGPEEKGLTALELCYNQWAITRTKDYEDTVVLLMDHNPHVAAKDVQLLATATINNSRKVLEKLHAAGANLNKPDQYGWTPIILATRFQQDEARKYLDKQLGLVGKRPSSFQANEPHIQVSEGETILTSPKGCNPIRMLPVLEIYSHSSQMVQFLRVQLQTILLPLD
jgi:ankyrin repeat protein